jgi:hypothetical protein
MMPVFDDEPKMNLFRLSLNLLRRDWRGGEWRVLLISLLAADSSIGGCAALIHPTTMPGVEEWCFCRVDKRSASTNFMNKDAA